MGRDFYIEIIKFKTKTYDPYEKKTKNRFELRNALYLFLKDKKKFIFEDSLDLRNVPQKIGIKGKDFFSSLSHTDDIGAFTFDSYPVGVDLENYDRIRKDVIARVSRPAELNLNPDTALLWSMKEAGFKSIPFIIQPKIISEVKVESIAELSKPALTGFKVYNFKASVVRKPKLSIEGIVLTNQVTQLAIARTKVK